MVNANHADERSAEKTELTDSDAKIAEADSPEGMAEFQLEDSVDSVIADWLSENPANAAERNRAQISPSLHMPQSVGNQSNEGNEGKKKCPMCAELIESGARICRFCRYDFSRRMVDNTKVVQLGANVSVDSGSVVVIVAILGFLIPVCFPIAWLLGNGYLSECEKKRCVPGQAGQIGRIIGKVATLVGLSLVFVFLLVSFVVILSNNSTGS